MADLHDATEHYLAAVFEIGESGQRPLRARLAERMRISAPSVTQGVERLIDRGLLSEQPDRSLQLTTAGREIATTVARRHRLAERLLLDVIGLPWSEVHEEADRWEHVISERVERRLIDLLGDPATCPHGNLIPGSRRKAPAAPSGLLSESQSGDVGVVRVSELLESDPDGLRSLERAGVLPGRRIRVVHQGRDVVTIESDGHRRRVSRRLADSVFVRS